MLFHSFDLGGGSRTMYSQKQITLNTWTNLRVIRHNKEMEIYFNQRRVARGRTPEKSSETIANLHTSFMIGRAYKLLQGKKYVY